MIDIELDELILLLPGMSQIFILLVAAWKAVCLIDKPEQADSDKRSKK